MTIAVIFSFLSNNPEMSFTKDHFIWGIVIFLIVFTGALYLFKRKELDTDAIYTMLSSSHYHFFLLIIFQGIKIFFY
jgi:hypothetical protein